MSPQGPHSPISFPHPSCPNSEALSEPFAVYRALRRWTADHCHRASTVGEPSLSFMTGGCPPASSHCAAGSRPSSTVSLHGEPTAARKAGSKRPRRSIETNWIQSHGSSNSAQRGWRTSEGEQAVGAATGGFPFVRGVQPLRWRIPVEAMFQDAASASLRPRLSCRALIREGTLAISAV